MLDFLKLCVLPLFCARVVRANNPRTRRKDRASCVSKVQLPSPPVLCIRHKGPFFQDKKKSLENVFHIMCYRLIKLYLQRSISHE